jgi:hypothetical protein
VLCSGACLSTFLHSHFSLLRLSVTSQPILNTTRQLKPLQYRAAKAKPAYAGLNPLFQSTPVDFAAISAPHQPTAGTGLADSRFQLTASPIRYASAATKAPKETSTRLIGIGPAEGRIPSIANTWKMKLIPTRL